MQKLRFRTAGSIVKEIRHNIERYGISKFYFNDDSFAVDKKLLANFSKKISEESYEIRWSCMTHESLIDKKSLLLMREAGCDSIHIGIESGSNRMLKLLGKKTTVEQILRKCKLINDLGIKIKAFFMVGMPSEKEEDLIESINIVQKIEPYEAILQIYVPYPRTKLWKYIEQNYGDPSTFYDWINFSKAKVNYSMFPDIQPQRFDSLLEEFFEVVENINKTNQVY